MTEQIPSVADTAIALGVVAVLVLAVSLRRGWFKCLAEWLGFKR